MSYRSYWRREIASTLVTAGAYTTIRNLCRATGMTIDDVISTLEEMDVLAKHESSNKYALRVDLVSMQSQVDKWSKTKGTVLDIKNLIWTPYILDRQNAGVRARSNASFNVSATTNGVSNGIDFTHYHSVRESVRAIQHPPEINEFRWHKRKGRRVKVRRPLVANGVASSVTATPEQDSIDTPILDDEDEFEDEEEEEEMDAGVGANDEDDDFEAPVADDDDDVEEDEVDVDDAVDDEDDEMYDD